MELFEKLLELTATYLKIVEANKSGYSNYQSHYKSMTFREKCLIISLIISEPQFYRKLQIILRNSETEKSKVYRYC